MINVESIATPSSLPTPKGRRLSRRSRADPPAPPTARFPAKVLSLSQRTPSGAVDDASADVDASAHAVTADVPGACGPADARLAIKMVLLTIMDVPNARSIPPLTPQRSLQRRCRRSDVAGKHTAGHQPPKGRRSGRYRPFPDTAAAGRCRHRQPDCRRAYCRQRSRLRARWRGSRRRRPHCRSRPSGRTMPGARCLRRSGCR